MIELAPGVHALGNGKGGHVHAFLLETGNELTLVDTLFEDDGRVVFQAIAKLGRQPRDLKHIAITHGHRSHLGGLAALKRESGATVHVNAWEADIVSGDRPAQPVTILPKQSLKLLPFQWGIFLNRPRHVGCPADELFVDGEAVGPLQVLDTPGHSPGHMAFWWPERRFLIAGDAVATWPNLCPGWAPFNLNRVLARRSLERMAGFEPTIVGVGHGDPITRGASDTIHQLIGAV